MLEQGKCVSPRMTPPMSSYQRLLRLNQTPESAHDLSGMSCLEPSGPSSRAMERNYERIRLEREHSGLWMLPRRLESYERKTSTRTNALPDLMHIRRNIHRDPAKNRRAHIYDDEIPLFLTRIRTGGSPRGGLGCFGRITGQTRLDSR